MGLIVTTIPSGGVYVDTTVSKGGTYIENNYVVPIATIERVFSNNTSSDVFSDVNSFDTSIYRILSMQDDMKTYTIKGLISDEFELFMQYAEDMTKGLSVTDGFIAMNEYLGSLGV